MFFLAYFNHRHRLCYASFHARLRGTLWSYATTRDPHDHPWPLVAGSILRSRPFWEEVTAALPPHRVWAVTGDDPAAGTEDFFLNGRARNATAAGADSAMAWVVPNWSSFPQP